ncbi:ATP-binding protein [Aquimarina agarivorans]|uniref:DNA polymerase III subunit n=1 Tax=Aquimarina agarivorans TaxID=980584 RepID=UPI000248E7FD|nr:DNA polymerase III subunit delta' [Aquimarina agarivorans]
MQFQDVLGLDHIKNHLQTSADQGRIAHAQLFCGANGSGTLPMAIAYARHVLCATAADKSSCQQKFDSLSHPDLHFVFPVTTNDSVKKHPVSDLFLTDWRTFLAKNPYASIFEWYQHIGVENKQGIINVDEAAQIVKKLSLKSYEGGYKIMIIWMANKMNTATSNKLLKLIEEPPAQTIFILITEDKEQIIQTISSRCQILEFPPLGIGAIAEGLKKATTISEIDAEKIANRAQGDYNKALQLLQNNSSEIQFETWFITWVRAAFKAKGNKAVINELIKWSEGIAANGREIQKKFLNYCIDFFRQALLTNYKSESLVFLEPQTANFDLAKFAPFVHGNNIEAIFEALEEALYHIERNGNSKIILTDLSIKLTRLLHAKP